MPSSPGAQPRSLSPFVPGQGPGPAGAAPAHWFLFRDGKMLVAEAGGAPSSPAAVPFLAEPGDLGLHPRRRHFLGTADGSPCFAADVPAGGTAAAGWSFHGLRGLFSAADDVFFRIAGRATQVLDWDRTHRFCGSCGAPTAEKPEERAKVCPVCGQASYPRISPAVIVAVVRGEEILLARASRFVEGMYSVLAGFVEPGETLEECVHREVKEETGVEVQNVRYFASQPWPFPNSLMVGFTAEHAAGEIVVDHTELVDARWFRADALPRIPDRITIARRLIDWFTEGCRG
jgi:NAD+ diphosphatase